MERGLRKLPGSPIMTECTAAMVLMDLSGSPASRQSHASGQSGNAEALTLVKTAAPSLGDR